MKTCFCEHKLDPRGNLQRADSASGAFTGSSHGPFTELGSHFYLWYGNNVLFCSVFKHNVISVCKLLFQLERAFIRTVLLGKYYVRLLRQHMNAAQILYLAM